jgi:hypothetical protein
MGRRRERERERERERDELFVLLGEKVFGHE